MTQTSPLVLNLTRTSLHFYLKLQAPPLPFNPVGALLTNSLQFDLTHDSSFLLCIQLPTNHGHTNGYLILC